LEVADAVREETRRRLNSPTSDQEYRKVRGDVSEETVESLLQHMRIELLYDHPWSEKSADCGSMREGRDVMVRRMDTGQAFYLETKWWEDIVRALGEGTSQARTYAVWRPDWKGFRIVGAYIVVLDWKVTKSARMWVERVA
jgi:hypothetical protein